MLFRSALLTVLVSVRIVQHVVRTDQLVIVRCEDNLTLMPRLLTPLHDFQNHRRRQLVVEVVQVTDIRLEVIQNFSQLYPCFLTVNRLDRIGQLTQFASTVEVHVTRVSINPVANATTFMIHTEVLNLVSMLPDRKSTRLNSSHAT